MAEIKIKTRKHKLWIALLLLVVLCTTAFVTDGGKISDLIQAGKRSVDNGNYYEASLYYEKVLEMDSIHPEANYQLAECYRNLFDYGKALVYYKKVETLHNDLYPLAGYYLGMMQRMSGFYRESIQTLDRFIRYASEKKFKDSQQFIDYAKIEQEGNQFVLERAMMPKGDFHFQRLNKPVNSQYNDYAASIYQHDSCIVLSSARAGTKGRNYNQKYGEFYSDNFIFSKSDTTWEDQTLYHGFSSLNTASDDGAGTFNKEKNKFFFTGCYQSSGCHLYLAELDQGKWSKPVALPAPVNLPGYNSKQPSLSIHADTLYFSSDRPGGYGQHDIWMSVMTATGKWSDPVNVGPEINTSQNEVAPFFYDKEKALFFSSNGHKGYGGFDILFATILPHHKPRLINLGQPFNSYKDDLYLSLGEDKGYLTSNRDNANGNFDIYTFDLNTRNVTILSLENKTRQTELSMYLGVLRFFDEKDQDFFQELPLEDKMKVKTLIEKKSLREALSDKSTLSEELFFIYKQLTPEEKERIDRLALAKKKFLLKENEDVLSREDYFYYENLPLEKKEKVNQIIEAKVFRNILIDQSEADEQLISFFEELPTEEQTLIQRTIQSRKQFLTKFFDDNATVDDMFFYLALSEEKREQMGQASISQDLLETLPTEEKARITRLANTRLFMTQVMEDTTNILLPPEEHNAFDIGALAIGNPENIKIQGSITRNQKPAASVHIIMESENGQRTVTTDQEGQFEFSNVNYHKKQKILFEPETPEFTQIAQYALEELTITVLQDTVIEETFDNIYFDTDKYTINDSSQVIIDSLASFHFRYPDVEIKIMGFADSTGTDLHNIKLSKKRTQEVYRYLMERGVDPSMLILEPMGEEKLEQENNLQYSRRIEFDIKGISSSYNPTREVYVIQASPNLESIAKKYDVPLSQLIEMNKGIEKVPQPFTPVRLVEQIKK